MANHLKESSQGFFSVNHLDESYQKSLQFANYLGKSSQQFNSANHLDETSRQTILVNHLNKPSQKNHLSESFLWIILANCLSESSKWIILLNHFKESSQGIFSVNHLCKLSLYKSSWWILSANHLGKSSLQNFLNCLCNCLESSFKQSWIIYQIVLNYLWNLLKMSCKWSGNQWIISKSSFELMEIVSSIEFFWIILMTCKSSDKDQISGRPDHSGLVWWGLVVWPNQEVWWWTELKPNFFDFYGYRLRNSEG